MAVRRADPPRPGNREPFRLRSVPRDEHVDALLRPQVPQQRRPERGQPVLAALDGGPQIGLEAGARVFSRTHRDPIEQAVQLVLQHGLQGVHLRTSRGPTY